MSRLLLRLKALFRDFFLRPSSGRPLAVLRISVAAAMLYEAVSVFPFLENLYGPYGYLQAGLIEALSGDALPGLFAKAGVSVITYSGALKFVYSVHILAALGLLLGWRARLFSVVLWLTQTMLINSGYLSSYGVDRYFHNLTFLMIWFPVASAWSIDRWQNRAHAPSRQAANTLGLRVAQIFILMTYIDAGVSKSLGTDWWNGEAVWRVLNQPEFHRFDFLWLAQVPLLPKLLSRMTMAIEAFYCVGFWLPYIGPLWALSIVGMHLSIAATMGLSLFGLTLAGVNAALFLVPFVSERAPVINKAC